MPLLNYTTKIEAARTVSEIQNILGTHGARSILVEYDTQGQVEAMSFSINTPRGIIGFRLPVNPDSILRVLRRQHIRAQVGHPQAVRVAWRIVKDWVEAQMALLETEMVRLEQVFLPYAVGRNGLTLGEMLVQGELKMLAGGETSPVKREITEGTVNDEGNESGRC